MRTAKLQNTFKQMMAGGVGASYRNTNLATGQIGSEHFSVKKLLDKISDSGIIEAGKQNVYPEEFKLNDEYVDQLDSRIYHQITSTGTYGTFKSYHDEMKPGSFKTKVGNVAIRNMLYKNQFELTVPGAGFIVAKASVGDIVKIQTISDDGDPQSTEPFDLLRTGEFLIYNTRHTFKNTRHDVVMTVCKLVRG